MVMKKPKRRPHACCNIESNMTRCEEQEQPGLKVVRCKICGCRHFHLTAEPGHMGMVMTS